MTGQDSGINSEACKRVAKDIIDLHREGMEIGVVIGAGNIFRGVQGSALGLKRSPSDHIGMLATLMNGIALQQTIIDSGRDARVLSALDCPKVAESYTWKKATDYLEREKIVIFVGGTGNPYFTTDTAAALRASEIQADLLLKATKVDGVYDKDPIKYSDAKRYDVIGYSQVLAEKLKVMDATAIALCRENSIPVLVFNMLTDHSISEVVHKQDGTLIKCD